MHLNSLPRGKILHLFKLKEFADNNLKFHENNRKFSNWEENAEGKDSKRAISPFPTVFFKRLVLLTFKNQGLFRKGSMEA